MTFPRNVFIATGAAVIVYIMLKLFMNNSDKSTKKTSSTKEPEEVIEDKTDENTVESIESEIKLENNKVPMKLLKQKPNFFLAFQVNNVGIHLKVRELQEKLLAKNPVLFPAILKVSTLHVTLAVTHLANMTEIETVKNKLDEWGKKNKEVFFEKPCILSFSGVKTFNNIVAYVDIDQCSNYNRIHEISNSLNNVLSLAGFSVDKRSFKPHLTFLKLSKDYSLLKKKKNFKDDFEFMRKCQEHFGKQEVTSVQLLSMNDPKDEAGYYKCYHQIVVSVSDAELDMDHSKCCSPILMPKTLVNKQVKNIFHNLKQKK